VFDAGWHGPPPPHLSWLRTAAIDAAVVLLATAALAWAVPIEPTATLAVLTLAYFSIGTVVFGKTPATWIIGRRTSISAAFTRVWSNRADEEPCGRTAPRRQTAGPGTAPAEVLADVRERLRVLLGP
jgi:hypothetical protein